MTTHAARVCPKCGRDMVTIHAGEETWAGTCRIRWCDNCGSIRVDLDKRGGTVEPGYFSALRTPTLYDKKGDDR